MPDLRDFELNSAAAGSRSPSRWRVAGLVFVFLWFAIGGLAHFFMTDAEMRIVPPIVPWPRAVVLVSGAFELVGAAGIAWHKTRRFAAMGLFVLTVAVTPAHIYMLQRPELFDVPYWALVLRLPVQLGLLGLIAWIGGFHVRRGGRGADLSGGRDS